MPHACQVRLLYKVTHSISMLSCSHDDLHCLVVHLIGGGGQLFHTQQSLMSLIAASLSYACTRIQADA